MADPTELGSPRGVLPAVETKASEREPTPLCLRRGREPIIHQSGSSQNFLIGLC